MLYTNEWLDLVNDALTNRIVEFNYYPVYWSLRAAKDELEYMLKCDERMAA